jgi:hypothetical protein
VSQKYGSRALRLFPFLFVRGNVQERCFDPHGEYPLTSQENGQPTVATDFAEAERGTRPVRPHFHFDSHNVSSEVN